MFLILFRQGRNTENKMHITNSHHVSLNDTNTCIRFQKVDKKSKKSLKDYQYHYDTTILSTD